MEVTNKTCENNKSLINSCDLSNPYLEHEALNNADLFEITIIPKSNVLGAQAGLKQIIQGIYPHAYLSIMYLSLNLFNYVFLEQYIYFNVSAIFPVVRKVSSSKVDVTVYLRTNVSYRNLIATYKLTILNILRCMRGLIIFYSVELTDNVALKKIIPYSWKFSPGENFTNFATHSHWQKFYPQIFLLY